MTTLKDIARACGVSAVTVSDILNNKAGAAGAETRERVLAAAREMHYRPNMVARGLRNGRTNAIGVILRYGGTPGTSNPAAMMLLDSILAVNTRQHKTTILVTTEDWLDEQGMSQNATLTACDGIIVTVPPNCDDFKPIMDRHKLPFVSIGTKSDREDISYVDIDNVAAAQSAVAHLVAKGHKRIAYFSDVDHKYLFAQERFEGYRLGMQAHGLPISHDWELIGPNPTTDLATLFRLPPKERPTALFCVTDYAALPALNVLVDECGLNVPDDVSLMGFDDLPAISLMRPALSTVRQPLMEIAETAATLLLDIIAGREKQGKKILLPAMVIERDSVTPPR